MIVAVHLTCVHTGRLEVARAQLVRLYFAFESFQQLRIIAEPLGTQEKSVPNDFGLKLSEIALNGSTFTPSISTCRRWRSSGPASSLTR
jgi:hypothetical protein